MAESAQETRITGMIAGDEGVFIGDAQFTNEALVDAEESQSESSANQ